jgi:hypothetical protein
MEEAIRMDTGKMDFNKARKLWERIAFRIECAAYLEAGEAASNFAKETGYMPIIPFGTRGLGQVDLEVYEEDSSE